MQYFHLLCYQEPPSQNKQLCLVFHEMQQQPPSSHQHHHQEQPQFLGHTGGTGTGAGAGTGFGFGVGGASSGGAGIHHNDGGLRELLVECAAAVTSSDWHRAIRCLVHLSRAASPHGDAVERLAFYFSAALARCLCSLSAPCASEIRSLLRLNNLHFLLEEDQPPPSFEDDLFYYSGGAEEAYLALNQVTPFIRFSHLSANQAILEAVDNERAVHIVDLGIMQGLQWPPLMQALVERRRLKQLEEEEQQQQQPPPSSPSSLEHEEQSSEVGRQAHGEEPPTLSSSSSSSSTTLTLRITGTGPSISLLEQTGARLRDFARTLHLDFEFDAVCTTSRHVVASLQQHLELRRGEALVVNCMTQLHKLLPAAHRAALPHALEFMRSLCPRILTVAEKESEHDLSQSFLERFLVTLDHYAAVFDSLEATLPPRSPQRLMIERLVLAKEISGIVLEDGGGDDENLAVVRHQSFGNWRRDMEAAGFQLVPPSDFAIAQAKLLLRLHYPADGYRLLVENQHGSLFLSWHDKPLVALSTWSC
ncbi:scarecrow-like protein 18 [Selaginella moellendorffii]|uniref:scarecrow-like protein 18 n=1 Tax=Selaginella moellendorffii TaxID=88036 RepID=UPI000D1C53D8|nr:scarecrow-like protein 18 [Selaginella moellendorffii]|eukprot:XP_024532244.1 scarecrow-like protein 18 [Selaginella moellendorffii]